MGFKIPVKTDTKISDGNDRSYDPLDPGKYVVSVFDAKAGKYGPNTGNKGRDQINFQFRISEGQPGANRRLFQVVGLFPVWAPTQKNPDGFDNFTFFQSFAALEGKSEKALRAEFQAAVDAAKEAGSEEVDFEVPSPSELKGRKIVVTLKIVPDTYAYDKAVATEKAEAKAENREPVELDQEDFKRNEIASFSIYDGSLPSAGGASTDSPKIDAVTL